MISHRNLASFVLLACSPCLAIAQDNYSQVEVLPSPSAYPPSAFVSLGEDIALSGDDLFLSSPNTFWGSNRDGIIFQFRRNGLEWGLVREFKSPLSGPSTEFGTAIDRHGSLLVATAPGFKHSGNQTNGAFFVIEDSGGNWTLNTIPVTAPVLSGSDEFGGSVATNGQWIVVGADLDDARANNAGAIHFYQPGVPAPTYHSTLYSPTPLDGSRFGFSLSMSGNRLAVGSPLQGAGAVEIFEFNGTWQHTHTITPQSSNGVDMFGHAVDLDGNRIAIGSPGSSQGGAVELYQFEPQVPAWFIESRVHGLPQTWTAKFGYSVDLSGDRVIVGAPETTVQNVRMGAGYVFERSGAGSWSLGKRLIPSGARQDDRAGHSVSITDDSIAVCSLHEDLWTGHSGSTALFEERSDSFDVFGSGDGSVGPCPCSNESVATREQGCRNSSALGAHLATQGSDSVSSDDLRFHAFNLTPGNPVILFSGTEGFLAPIPMGDGLRFAGTRVVRLGVKVPSPAGKATWGPGLAGAYGWNSNETLYLQSWYRDTVGTPCGAGFNLSGGVSVDLQP